MAKTYEITITMVCDDEFGSPNGWDWGELICTEPDDEILNVTVKEVASGLN